METDLLNSVGEIRPGEGEVLQGTALEYRVHTTAGEGEGQMGEAQQ